MSTPEAIKRAKEKYRKEKTYRVLIEFTPNDQDLIDKLKALPSKQKYIKELIRADIEKDTQ